MAKKHSSEAFIACNDPLEAVVFSVLVETIKRQDLIELQLRKDGESLTRLTLTAGLISGQRMD